MIITLLDNYKNDDLNVNFKNCINIKNCINDFKKCNYKILHFHFPFPPVRKSK